MAPGELNALLDGAAGATLTLLDAKGVEQIVHFERHELLTPAAWRAALRRQMPADYEPPVYGVEDHGRIVRALFALVDARHDSRLAHVGSAG